MGIPESSLQKGAHWRKPWPYGIDNGDDDEDVLNMGGIGRTKKVRPPPVKYTYPFTIDSDVIDTQRHLG